MKFWDEFGFIIVDNVLNQDEINATVDEVWEEVEIFDWTPYREDYKNNHAHRNDSSTWVSTHFPTSSEGFFGLVVTEGKQAIVNRQNEKFYGICKNILGQDKLWVSFDRYGIMRPTKNVPVGNLPEQKYRTVAFDDRGILPVKDFPEWKTHLELHWDLNPWLWTSTNEGIDYSWDDDFIQENNGSRNTGEPKIQGFINLADNRFGDGGFVCVPGFNRVIGLYSEQTKDSNYRKKHDKEYAFVALHPDDNLQKQAKNISIRAGSVLIWSSELPHCNYANDSNKFRIVQYMKMFSAKEGKPGSNKRREEVTRMIRAINVPVTELGKKILGIENW